MIALLEDQSRRRQGSLCMVSWAEWNPWTGFIKETILLIHEVQERIALLSKLPLRGESGCDCL